MIRVLLVEDHAVFRGALAFLLGREPDLEVVAQADSLTEPEKRSMSAWTWRWST
jgi:DNA-binding NarL/FixJ family response regulator